MGCTSSVSTAFVPSQAQASLPPVLRLPSNVSTIGNRIASVASFASSKAAAVASAAQRRLSLSSGEDRSKGQRPAPVPEAEVEEEEEAEEDQLPRCITGQTLLELRTGEQVWGTPVHLGDDAWAAAIVAFCRVLPVIVEKRKAGKSVIVDLVHFVVSLSVVVVNLALQFGILWYICEYVVEPSVHDVQVRYRHFRAHALDDNDVLQQDVWGDYEYKREICQIAMINTVFYYSIMLVWVLTNLTEWRNIERLWRNNNRLQTCTFLRDCLVFMDTMSVEKGGPCFVVAITSWVRAGVTCLVIVPRLLISLFLSWLGLRMLASSQNFGDMVMNTLALGFVVSIDELLCQSVLPLGTRKLLENTELFIKEGSEPKNQDAVEDGDWQGCRRTAFWIIGSVGYLYLYSEYLQEVLPVEVRQLRSYCDSYLGRLQKPVCDRLAIFGSQSCYPPGIGSLFDDED